MKRRHLSRRTLPPRLRRFVPWVEALEEHSAPTNLLPWSAALPALLADGLGG